MVTAKDLRARLKTGARRRRWTGRGLRVEELEDRCLMAIQLQGVPNWGSQGPAPMNNAQLVVPPINLSSGAIESVAVNPANASNLIAGTANGGVWRTVNANPANPGAITWTPVTDQFGSLSIGSVAFSLLDRTGNTVFAGTGDFSNGFDGGDAIGLLRSTDGGNTWSVLGASALQGHRIKTVLPTAINLGTAADPRQVILVGTINGTGRNTDASRDPRVLGGALYRSTDNGVTFTQILGGGPVIPNGAVTSLIADPNNAMRVYAGIPGQGVLQSNNGGFTWSLVNTGLTNIAGASDIELAAMNDGGSTVLYAGVATGNTLNGVFRSTDNGTNWTALAAPPAAFNAGAAYAVKFAIAAAPATNNVVYISGQTDSDIYRYDPAGAGNWVQIAGAGALAGTAPHADSRDLVFLNNTTLIETDDGGIDFMANPTNATANAWRSFVGNMGDTEFYSVAYDATNRVLFGGAQDNGSSVQTGPGVQTWVQVGGGDGQLDQVDNTSVGTDTLRYALANTFGAFQRDRFNNANQQLNLTQGLITAATNATPIVITTNNTRGLMNGDRVRISGVVGNAAANGGFQVMNVGPNGFTLVGSVGNGNYLGGGTWQRYGAVTMVDATKTPVEITSAGNRLQTGDQVRIRQTGDANLDGNNYYITRINANTFSLNGTAADGTMPATGFWFKSDVVTLKTGIGAKNLSGLNAADQAANGFVSIPYVLNAVNPRQMLIGYNGVYEDTGTTPNAFAGDVIANITGNVGALAGQVSALAYGGRRAGVNYAQVAYVGTTGGQLFFRGEAGAGFTQISGGGAGELPEGTPIRSLVIDPQDWRRVYVITGSQVWLSDNVTNLGASPFRNITGNLGSLTTQIRSIALFDNTPAAAGDSTPVVGGLGGVFRWLGGTWSRYGTVLPETLVQSVRYVPGTDSLVAGTFGRGAWTLGNVGASVTMPGVLTINGDMDFPGENDVIDLRRDPNNPVLLDVFVNNNTPTPNFTVEWSTLQTINVNGLGGNDTITIEDCAPGVAINVDGGPGNDIVNIGNAANQMNGIQGPVNISAGPGTDILNFNDQGTTTAGLTYTLTANMLMRTGLAPITFGLFNKTTLNTAASASTIDIRATAQLVGGTTTVNGGPANDEFNVGGATNTLDGILGALTLVAGSAPGVDTVNFNDQGTPADRTYNLTPNTLDRQGAATITFSTFNVVTLNAGMGKDAVSVQGTTQVVGGKTTINTQGDSDTITVGAIAKQATTVINAGAGDDTINVGSAANKLDGISGALTVNGQGHTTGDTLNVNDQGTTTANTTYTVTATTIARTGGPTIQYGTIEFVTLNGGSGGNTIQVQATGAGVKKTQINAGAGDDTIKVGNAAHKLNAIQGPLSVDGQGGSNKIILRDDGNQGPLNYTSTANSISRPGIAKISTSNYKERNFYMALVAGGGGLGVGNQLAVQSTLAGSIDVVFAGNGDDTIDVGGAANNLDGIAGALTVNGGGGVVTLNLDDQGAPTAESYELASGSLTRSNAAKITFGAITHLNLNGGGSGNSILLEGNASGTATVLDGGAGTNSLTGSAQANSWDITGADSGTLSGPAVAGSVAFRSMQDLTGGASGDTFTFADGGSVSGSVAGGGGINALDYAGFSGNVLVDLPLASATGVGGSVNQIEDVYGSNGPGYDILVGDGGNQLVAGGTRSLMIAGSTSSTLMGGNQDDILIGGTTQWDTNLTALQAIMAEWSRTDIGYSQRVDHLMNGGGLNGTYLLNSLTVQSNGGGNTLDGGLGLDVFFGSLTLDTNDWDPTTEVFVSI